MQNLFPVHHSPRVCNNKIKHTDLYYFHLQLTWLDWSRSRSRSRSFWSRSHNRFLVSVSVSVSHSLVSVLALVSLCSGLINKPVMYIKAVLLLMKHLTSFVRVWSGKLRPSWRNGIWQRRNIHRPTWMIKCRWLRYYVIRTTGDRRGCFDSRC